MLFERVAILGVGLIGGSFALALKEARACGHMVGAGRNSANLKLALGEVEHALDAHPRRADLLAEFHSLATPGVAA